MKTGPLVEAGIDEIEGVLRGAGAWAYLAHYAYMLPDRIDRIHRAGCRVFVWTVDAPEAMLAMARSGVDGIMTNHTRTLRQLFDKLGLPRRPWPQAAAWR